MSGSGQDISYHRLMVNQVAGSGGISSAGINLAGAGAVTFLVELGADAAGGQVVLQMEESEDGITYDANTAAVSPQTVTVADGWYVMRIIAAREDYARMQVVRIGTMTINSVVAILHEVRVKPGVSTADGEWTFLSPPDT